MSRRDRTVVGALAVIAALAGFWFFGLAPKRKAISAANAEIATQQQRLDQAQATVNAAQSAKNGYAANTATVAGLGKAVPADDDIASLVYQLQSVAAGSKVTFKSIKLTGDVSSSSTPPPASSSAGAPASQVAAAQLPPGAVVGTAGLATMPFTFIFEGRFLDMQKFLARVDEFVKAQGDDVRVSGRLLTVDGISLGDTASKSSSTVKATIAATAYLSPKDTAPATTATGATAPAPGTTTPSTGAPSASTGTTTTSAAVTATSGS